MSTIEIQEPMQHYVGIKEIEATVMTRNKWLARSGKPIDVTEDDTNGYMIRYPDGYISWSPQKAFEDAYRSSGELSYALALHQLQTKSPTIGVAIYRRGWNGAGQRVIEVDGTTLADGINRNYGDPSNPDNNPVFQNALFLKNAQGQMFPWSPSSGDTNATDWCVEVL